MQHGDPGAEAAAESIYELGRECDFRHQNQRLTAVGDGGGDDAQIHFSLAAARDTVKEMGGELSEGGEQRVDHHALRLRERHLAGMELELRGLG